MASNVYARFVARILRHNLPDLRHGVEVGVWEGMLSVCLLQTFPKLHLLMVDRYEICKTDRSRGRGIVSTATSQDVFLAAMTKAIVDTLPFKKRRSLLVADSVQASKWVENGSMDFVFLDADHSRKGVRKDLVAWYPKIRSGGIFCGHDYGGKHPGVACSVDRFVADNGLKLNVRKNVRIWWTKV